VIALAAGGMEGSGREGVGGQEGHKYNCRPVHGSSYVRMYV
jgi:hypothetical protein